MRLDGPALRGAAQDRGREGAHDGALEQGRLARGVRTCHVAAFVAFKDRLVDGRIYLGKCTFKRLLVVRPNPTHLLLTPLCIQNNDTTSYEGEEARKTLVQELHLLKTQLFMDTIEAGKVPLRPGVLRVVDEAIKAGVPLVRGALGFAVVADGRAGCA